MYTGFAPKRAFISLGAFLLFILAASAAHSDTELKFEKAVTHGGAGNQTGGVVKTGDGRLHVAGLEADNHALFTDFAMPPAEEPLQKCVWSEELSGAAKSSTMLTDMAISPEGTYAAGYVWSQIGGKKKTEQTSGLIVKFPAGQSASGKPIWTVRSDFYPDQNNEVFRAIAVVTEKGSIAVYAAGFAATGDDNATAILAKYDAGGKLLWSKLLGGEGAMKKSSGTALAVMDGFVYVAGYVTQPTEKTKFASLPLSPALWKVDTEGKQVWVQTGTATLRVSDSDYFMHGVKVDLAAHEGFLYLTASKKDLKASPGDILFMKYDADGTLVWENAWNAVMPESHLKANEAHAAAMAPSSDRIFVAGWVSYTDKLHPGKDTNALILEVDKDYGSVLAVHFHGVREASERALAITVGGNDVYAAGAKEPPEDKNKKKETDHTDLMLLRFSMIPTETVAIDILPGTAHNALEPWKPETDAKKKKKAAEKTIEAAVLSSASFNAATQVDLNTLTFGPTGHEAVWTGCSVKDVDQNGSADLLCYFKESWTPWQEETALFDSENTEGVIRGQTNTGKRFFGKDSVKVGTGPSAAPAPAPAPAPVPVSVPVPPAPQPVSPPAPEPQSAPQPEPEPMHVPEPVFELEPPHPVVPTNPPAPLAPPVPPSEAPTVPNEQAAATHLISVPLTAHPLQPAASAQEATTNASPKVLMPMANANQTSASVPPAAASTTPTAPVPPKPIVPAAAQPAVVKPAAAQVSVPIPVSRTLYARESAVYATPTPAKPLVSEQHALPLEPAPKKALEASDRPTALAMEYGKMGEQARQKGKIQEAITHFEDALRLDPEVPELHVEYGALLMAEGRLEDAAKHFSEALKLNPNDLSAKENLAKVQALLAV